MLREIRSSGVGTPEKLRTTLSLKELGQCGRIMYTVYIAFLLALACGLTHHLYLESAVLKIF